MKKLNKIIKIDGIEIMDQKFIFRPTSQDRKPLVGEHPIIKNLFTVNGMGSKAIQYPAFGPRITRLYLPKNLIDSMINITSFQKKLMTKI